jgi:GNAT superfamily N-acetyltransferase
MLNNMSSVLIRQAVSPEDIAAVRQCFDEYTQWLDEGISFQGYQDELATLPGKYSPPDGALLIAVDSGTDQVLGCVAMRPLALLPEYRTTECRHSRRYCEMKRLFVYPHARGRSVGRLLIKEVVALAQARGYDEVLLDTLLKMSAAIQLYRSEGFVEIEPYCHSELQGVKYFARKTQPVSC